MPIPGASAGHSSENYPGRVSELHPCDSQSRKRPSRSDRRRGTYPTDDTGERLIDAGALLLSLRALGHVHTARDLRRWARRHQLQPVRRGAHGAWLYRWRDVEAVLDRIDPVG